jgi:hypothetical protein
MQLIFIKVLNYESGKVSDRLNGNLRTNNAHGRGQDLKPKIKHK